MRCPQVIDSLKVPVPAKVVDGMHPDGHPELLTDMMYSLRDLTAAVAK